MKRCYISGAIAGHPQIPRTPEIIAARKALFYKGCDVIASMGKYEAVNPLDVPACPDGRCIGEGDPLHAAMLPIVGHTWACFLRFDLMALLACDAIAMLPGWQNSEGAQLELTVAAKLGFDVLYFNETVTGLTYACTCLVATFGDEAKPHHPRCPALEEKK